jgi:hypothetical protein
MVDMAEQDHELWLDRTPGYTLVVFYDDMTSNIIWGRSQTLSIWVMGSDTES